MQVKAKHWINVGGDWHKAGDVFEVESTAGIEESVEVVADTKSVAKKPTKEPETATEPVEKAEQPKRRGRTTKS